MSTQRVQMQVVTSPLSEYEFVKARKHPTEKDELIVSLLSSSLASACEDLDAVDACQAQLELTQEWCRADRILTEPQSLLVSRLLAEPLISTVCVLSLSPVFDIYVVGTATDTAIYDLISDRIVDYKYASRSSAAYMYMTEEEFSSCNTAGIIKIFSK